MKRILLLFCLGFMLGGGSVNALEMIDLTVGYIDPHASIPGIGKGPTMYSLWQDGYELTFPSMHPEYALDIVLNGIVVYSTNVSETTTTVILPSWLSGEYELQLYPEDCSYYFYGYVTL